MPPCPVQSEGGRSPSEDGTVTSFVESDDLITVEAVANAGYEFVNWTEEGLEISVSKEFSFTVTGRRELVANFKLEDPLPDTIDSIIGLYDPVDGNFHLRGEPHVRFGPRNSDWQPLTGDWNRDGNYTLGLYDPAEGNFWLYLAPGNIEHIGWGGRNSNRVAIAGDWNGDGIYGVGLYDHEEGKFYLRLSSDEQIEDRFGSRGNSWIPVAGDWNGDGSHSVALYDLVDGNFHAYDYGTIRFGPKEEDWTPVTGDWNGNNTYGVGLHHDGHFHLDTGEQVRFGPRGDTDWIPVTGWW